MPRGGSGVYTQPFPDVVENTTIESLVYNGFTRDVETDLNAPRPVVAGGTGANNADQALENLNGVSDKGDTMTGDLIIDEASPALILSKKLSGQFCTVAGRLLDKNRWTVILGGPSAEGAGNVGSNFHIQRHGNDGALIDAPFVIDRNTSKTTMTGEVAIAGRVAITAASTSPPLPPVAAPASIAQLAISKTDDIQSAAILGQHLGIARWRVNLGDTAPEGSTQTGCNFRIERYNNAGAFIDFPVYIERSNGQVTLTGNPTPGMTNPACILALNSDNVTASSIQGRNGNITQWQMALGDGTSAADFRLNRYNDSGTLIDVPLWINRNTGVTTITGSPPDQGAILTINKTSGGGLMASSIQGQTLTSTRWHLALGDGAQETGGNVGSDFKIHRHNDSGTFNSAVFYISRATGRAAFFDTIVYKPTGGSFSDPSDARIKTVVGDYESGLAEVLALHPVRYKFNGTDVSRPDPNGQKVGRGEPNPDSDHYLVAQEGKEHIGLIAQEAEVSMPEMVTKMSAEIDGVPVDDYRVMNNSALVYALVNAVKELSARLEALEAVKR